MEDREVVLEQVGPLRDRRERQPELAVLVVVPARAEPELDPAAGHLVDRRHDLGEVARVAERDRGDQSAEPDPRCVPGQSGEDRPGIGGPLSGRPRKALVVVGPEERLEAGRLGPPDDRQLLLVGQALLGLDHEREAHVRLLSRGLPMLHVDAMIASW